MRRRISIRGYVRPSVRPWVRPSVGPSVRGSVSIKEKRELGASYVEYPALLCFPLNVLLFLAFFVLLSVSLLEESVCPHVHPSIRPYVHYQCRKTANGRILLPAWACSSGGVSGGGWSFFNLAL